jgi:hypothetical protein
MPPKTHPEAGGTNRGHGPSPESAGSSYVVKRPVRAARPSHRGARVVD